MANVEFPHAGQEAFQIARHLGSDRGVEHGGGQALVFAELGQHVGRLADVGVGHFFQHYLRRAALMRRVAVGVQEADRDGLDAGLGKTARGIAHLRFVQRRQHVARCVHPLVDFGAEFTRHRHGRFADAVVVQVRTRLAADLQHIAKAARGDEPDARALAFDDEVGGHRGAVAHVRDLRWRDTVIREHLADARGDGLGGIVRRGRHFVKVHHTGILVDHREIGKRASDVYPYAIHIDCSKKEGQSRRMPAFFTTWHHLLISSLIIAPNAGPATSDTCAPCCSR